VVPLKLAGMEIDRELLVQAGVSVAVVAVFIGALALISSAYGSEEVVDNRSLNGTLDGTFTGNVTDGEVAGTFDGQYKNSVNIPVEGSLSGTVENGTVVGEFNGTASGAIDGTVHGEVNGTLETESEGEVDGSLEGEFQGVANGTTGDHLSETGALALLALIVVFIVGMSVAGYVATQATEGE
jgi:hypothetical protein